MNGLPSPNSMRVIHPGVTEAPAASPPASALTISTHKEGSVSGLLLLITSPAFLVLNHTL